MASSPMRRNRPGLLITSAAAAQRALQIWEQSNKPTAAAATRSRLTLYTDKQ